MKLYWYIQPLSHHENTAQRIAYLAEERGITVISDDYRPFGATEWKKVLEKTKDGVVTVLGSINAVRSAQHDAWPNGYNLVHWCGWEDLSCSRYYAHWGKYMLSQTYGFYPLKELIRLADSYDLYDLYGKRGFIFVRPDTNDKVFPGELLHYNHIPRWLCQVQDLPPHLLCLAAKPSEIESEYRLVISDKKVIAASRYKRETYFDTERGCPADGIALAEEAAQVWCPHDFFVMDLALSKEDGKFYILECGSVNVAGFYECDLVPITEAFIKHMEKDGEAYV